MKSLPFRAITILTIAILVSCTAQSNPDNITTLDNPTDGTWQDQSESPLEFELEQVYGDNEEILFAQSSQLEGPAVDSVGNLYIIDGQNGTMYSFDPEGIVRWQTGEKGKGPGDFQRPKGLVTDGEYLYTGNVGGSRIDQFDFEGNLVNSTSLESLDLSFATVEGFISDSLLVTTSTIWGKLGEKVTILNTADSLNKVNQFDIVVAPKIDLGEGLSSGFSIQIVDSLIAAGNVQDYALQFFNRKGSKIKTIKRDFDKLVRPGYFHSGGSRTISDFGGLNAPSYLPDGYYLTTLNWPTNIDDPDQWLKSAMNDRENAQRPTYKNSIDLYKADGTLLYSLEQEGSTPDIGSFSHIDENGKIYTKTDEPYPQIRRYSLTINAPNE